MGRRLQKGAIALVVVGVVFLVGIGYLLFSSKVLKTNKNTELSGTQNGSASQGSNTTLQKACKVALNDYPEWTKADTDLIIWENPDKSFNFRNSPEDASSKLTSPVPSEETLVDMDFIGMDKISYVTTGAGGWKINTLKLNGLGAYDKSLVYEKSEAATFVDVSPLGEKDYFALVVNGKNGVVKRINTANSKEDLFLELAIANTGKIKLAASPKASYGYLLNDGPLILFEIVQGKQIDKIDAVKSAVWVGDGYLLYSNTEGIFVYNLKNKEKTSVSNTKQVSALAFNPKGDGTIAFDENGNTTVVDCQTWQIINSKQGAEFKTLTSEKTAINKKGDQFGFWRFRNKDWVVKMLEEKSKFVTVWQRY